MRTRVTGITARGDLTVETQLMKDEHSNLRFNIMRTGTPITAVCTNCGHEFVGAPAKNADEAILKIKAEFKAHKCKNALAPKSNGEGTRWIC